MYELASTCLDTALAKAADVPVVPASQLAGRFPLDRSCVRTSAAEVKQKLNNLEFGSVFSAHMAHARWCKETGWVNHEIIPFADLRLSPAAAILHYGQEVFEGIKAYKHADGSIWTFRPQYNAARLNFSAQRLALPPLPETDFIASLVDLVNVDAAWVPGGAGESLYLRPFMFASEPFLGIRSANMVDYYVIGSPCGAYFPENSGALKPISIWVCQNYHRAGRGGTGAAKTGGNYAASLLPQAEAAAQGCDQVCFLDDVTESYIEELGGMNIMIVNADGTVCTPKLNGTILEGNTRSAIIRLLLENGHEVAEENITLKDLLRDIKTGKVSEVFACGTAAAVAPIGRLKGIDFDVQITDSAVTNKIYDQLTGIQFGRYPDPHNWMYRLV